MIIFPIKDFIFGLKDKVEAESIPRGSLSSVLNWLPVGDKIELRRGMLLVGSEQSGSGKITGLHTTVKADGTEITYRKRGQKLEYYDTTTSDWLETGTNIFGADAEDEDAAFSDYTTNHGNQLWVSSPNSSLFKIMNANPESYTDMYDSSKNYKGYIKIILNRMFLWNRKDDKSGVYGSYIDELNSTTVTNEVIGTGDGSTKLFTNTLVFKAAGAKRTCFGVTVTDGTETFSDNFDGTLTGDKGGTGTINYASGAISVTFNTNVTNLQDVTCNYSWEDSTNNGIADFTKSSPRTAGQGVIFRQDVGGTTQNIFTYNDIQYCLHQFKTWRLNIGADDTNATNRIYRELAGISNWRAAVATGHGIYYIDDSDISSPQFRVIQVEAGGDEVKPVSISYDINLDGYLFDKSVCAEFNDYILFSCRTSDSNINNRIFVFNKIFQNYTIIDYRVDCFTVNNGELWSGDSGTDNVYKLFSGVDDDESTILNLVVTNLDNIDIDRLKKVKRLLVRGEIQIDQSLEVYAAYDNGDFVLVDTIEGTGSYVDYSNKITVGNVTVGSKTVGSGDVLFAYQYEKEIKIKSDKFEKVKLKFIATNLGYVSVSKYSFKDVRVHEQRLPTKYRS